MSSKDQIVPIRFACAQCGKQFRVADGLAGKRGRCGRCGCQFAVPGVVSQPSFVFMPAVDPDPVSVNLRPRRIARARSSEFPLVRVLLATVGVLWAMAALDTTPTAQIGTAHYLVRRIAGPVGVCSTLAVPLVIPVVLSRRRFLSIGRWLIFAGLCASIGLVFAGLTLSGIVANEGNELPVVALAYSLVAFLSLLAF